MFVTSKAWDCYYSSYTKLFVMLSIDEKYSDETLFDINNYFISETCKVPFMGQLSKVTVFDVKLRMLQEM